ncbi:MAG TPA: hypothetical protein VKV37_14635 [Ktedonobacteraceae bacterium]|jgi:hypothetical protein|nr:hypothetical protein [Ktedonobacteraceae bacterium]
MQEPEGEALTQAIDNYVQQLAAIDKERYALENQGMEAINPLRYFAIQPEIDRLMGRSDAIQKQWARAMDKLAIYRMEHPAPADHSEHSH